MGLACTESTGLLYAVTAGEGSKVPELYTIDTITGVESLVGVTGTPDNVLQSLEHVRFDSMTSKLYAGGDELNEQTELATGIGGSFETLWGLAMADTTPVPALLLPAWFIAASLVAGSGAAAAKRRR